MRYSGAISTLQPLTMRPCLALPLALSLALSLALMTLTACGTQVELRMAAQQEQFGREAASRGDWTQAMHGYADAAQNAELGHGDPAWQARLHHAAGRAASAACRYDAAAFHFRSAIALAKQGRQSSALSYKALIDLYARQGLQAEAQTVRNELDGHRSHALEALADTESLPVGKPCVSPP